MSSTMEPEVNIQRQLLEKRHEQRLKARINRIESARKDKDLARLQEENVAFKEKLKAAFGTINELKEQVRTITRHMQNEVSDWTTNCTLMQQENVQLLKENKTIHAKHQTELQKISKICENKMSEQTETHESEVSKAKAVKMKLQGQVSALQDQHLVDKESHAKVRASLKAAEKESQCVNKCLEEVTLQKEELEKHITRKDNLAQINSTKYFNLRKKYDKLKERTAEIETMDALKENLASSERAMAEQKKTIKTLKKEIAVLKNTINQNEEEIQRKEKEIAILNLESRNELSKGLEDKLREAENNCKKEIEAMKKVEKNHAFLTKKVMDNTYLVKTYKMEQKKDKEKIASLENLQQQTKKDLHGCFQLISDPVAFKQKLIAYYRRYLDGDTTVVVLQDTIATEAGIKKAAQAYRTSVLTDKFNERDQFKKMLMKKQKEDALKSQHIDIINTQRRQIKTLEEHVKLLKPPKPPKPKVQSCRFPPILPEVLKARQNNRLRKPGSRVPEGLPRLPLHSCHASSG